ncbi:MAG: hypothetical protein HGGPFJEG_02430 [Ignavibacteria bacterium]|nr:hypothetical protein [Ignavibacteria bacterium]
MKSNKTYIYLIIFAALLIAAYFLTTDRGEKTSSYNLKEKKLFEVDSAKVDKIEIKNKDGDLVLSKSTGEWRVVSPYDYRVTSAQVEKIVSSLKNLKLESIISSNPAKKETFGFSPDKQAEISVFEAGVLKGKFILGTESAGSSSHIKKPDSDDIYIADNIERVDFIKPNINDWRDKNILSVPKAAINSIVFISGDENFSVKRDSAGKYFIGADSVGSNFSSLVNVLERFETNGFKDTVLADNTKFDKTIIVDWGNKSIINFLKLNQEPVKYLVKVDGDKQIYELDEVYANNLLKSRKDLLGK